MHFDGRSTDTEKEMEIEKMSMDRTTRPEMEIRLSDKKRF